jgi:hypothetical protein
MAEREEDVVARLEALLAEKEKKPTAVGKIMKNGGGAVAGGYVGGTIGLAVGAALAPFTFGLSVPLAPILGAVVVGKLGHDMSKDID